MLKKIPEENVCRDVPAIGDLRKKAGSPVEAEFETLRPRLMLKLPPEEFHKFRKAMEENSQLKVSFAADGLTYSASMIDPRCGFAPQAETVDFDDAGRVQVHCAVTDGRYIFVLPNRLWLDAITRWQESGGGIGVTSLEQEDAATASMIDVRCGSVKWSNSRTASIVEPRCGQGTDH